MRGPAFGLATVALVAALGSNVQAGGGRIYWTDEFTDTIERANLDGSGMEELVGIEDAENPGALAVEAGGGKIYWAGFPSPPFVSKIKRANLDGSDVEEIVFIGGKTRVAGIAADPVHGHLLYTDPSDCGGCGFVDRSGLDGSAPEHLITALNFPNALAVDPALGFVWWSESAFDDLDGIYRAELDGSHVQLIVPGPDAFGLAFDPGGGKLYWTDSVSGKIQRSDAVGAGVEDLVTGLDWPHGIALDTLGGKMYWADRNAGTIQRADLDGSNVETILSGLPRPTAVAVTPSGGDSVPALSARGAVACALVLLALGVTAVTARRRQAPVA